jgi:hypothetical protein
LLPRRADVAWLADDDEDPQAAMAMAINAAVTAAEALIATWRAGGAW